jgi:hypothetical protein
MLSRRQSIASVVILALALVLGAVLAAQTTQRAAAQLVPPTLYFPRIDPTGVTLTWSPSGSTAYYYVGRRGPPDVTFPPIAVIQTTTFFDNNFTYTGEYCYIIFAKYGELETPSSNIQCVNLTSATPVQGYVENDLEAPTASPLPSQQATAAPTTTSPTPAPTVAAVAATASVSASFALQPSRLPQGCSLALVQAPGGISIDDIVAHLSVPRAVTSVWSVDPTSGRVSSLYFQDVAAPADAPSRTVGDQQVLWFCLTVPASVR